MAVYCVGRLVSDKHPNRHPHHHLHHHCNCWSTTALTSQLTWSAVSEQSQLSRDGVPFVKTVLFTWIIITTWNLFNLPTIYGDSLLRLSYLFFFFFPFDNLISNIKRWSSSTIFSNYSIPSFCITEHNRPKISNSILNC